MKCFACDRKLGKGQNVAHCEDDQWVYVGAECFKHIRAAGASGWQPPKGGPRLYRDKQPNSNYSTGTYPPTRHQ